MINKYRNKKTEIDGHKFDSHKEAKRYTELLYMMKAGEIFNLELQKEYVIVPKCRWYKAVKYNLDFYYKLLDGTEVHEDVKPTFTNVKSERKYKASGAYRVFKIKQKLMFERYNILVLEK